MGMRSVVGVCSGIRLGKRKMGTGLNCYGLDGRMDAR